MAFTLSPDQKGIETPTPGAGGDCAPFTLSPDQKGIETGKPLPATMLRFTLSPDQKGIETILRE